jgi:hypothetical protein
MLAGTLFGCAPSNPSAILGSQRNAPPSAAIFATQLAGPETYLAPMPTAVIILKPDDMAGNRAFCAAMTKLPTAGEAMAKSVVAPNLVLTRWLTQLPEVPPDRVRDCDYLVGTYDYGRAAALMAAFHANVGSMAGNGPFLALIVPGDNGLRVVAVDGSLYSADKFEMFVASWNDAIIRTQTQLSIRPDRPGIVRSVFDLVSAIFRTVFGGASGLIQGTVGGL